jgi:hypothetical protein
VTASPQPPPESNILGNFASVVGLLGVALFFTGWIYRWSYFYCFQLNVITLDLPVESFFLVPLQVFLGDGPTILRSAIALLLTALAIYLTLWLVNSINKTVAAKINRRARRWRFYAQRRRLGLLHRFLKSWQRFNINRLNSIKLLRSLVDEIIIVGWVLLVLVSIPPRYCRCPTRCRGKFVFTRSCLNRQTRQHGFRQKTRRSHTPTRPQRI